WDRLTETVQERLVEPYPRFRQAVVESHVPGRPPHWEDDADFDISTHIHHLALPAPGDQAALQELVGDLMVRPLDRSRPLWEMYMIDGYRDGAAVLVRMHHCIADGIALARVMLSLTDAAPDAGVEPLPPDAGQSGGPAARFVRPAAQAAGTARKLAGTLVHEGVESLLHPNHVRELASGAAADAEELAKMLLKPPDAETVLKGQLHVPDKVAWSQPVPLEEVKRIGHATGTTVNDVLVSAVTGGLHDYLRGRHSLVDSVRAFVPFNLRPLDQPLPRELGNRFGLVYLDLPVGLRTARTRLREVKTRMDEIKSSPQGAVAYALLGAIGQTPVQVEKIAIDLFSSRGSCVITNVPGPREPVYLAGTPMAGVLVWAPTSGSVSMSVSIFSYAGKVTAGLLVDAGLVPDPEKILAGFQHELRALGELATKSSEGTR
ncbi:MAG: wax ester/triacylglycerol synthase family O-acyltransferase, partial [Solirubrobacterales bacterium]